MSKLKVGFILTVVTAWSLTVASIPATSDDSSVRFSVLLVGNAAGHQISTRSGDEITVHFEFNDRGRGPKIDSRIVLGEGGIECELRRPGRIPTQKFRYASHGRSFLACAYHHHHLIRERRHQTGG